jgi:hypothetical protein
MNEVFFEGFGDAADGPFVVANFIVQPENQPIIPVQVRVTFRALDSFESVVKQRDPTSSESAVRERLSAYLGLKIADKLDAGDPLEPTLDFVASPTEPAAFHLDALDVQTFLRRHG